MKKTVCILFGLIMSLTLFSQKPQKRIYLDIHARKTSKPLAKYYRLVEIDTINIKSFVCKDYYLDDKLFQIGHYKSLKPQLRHGSFIQYYPSGTIKKEIEFYDNKVNGSFKSYYENGNIMRIEKYSNDSLIDKKHYTVNGTDTSMNCFLQFPIYKNGGVDSLRKFVEANLKYPDDCMKKGIQGKVYLQFCINSKGELVDIVARKSLHPFLSSEAIRVLKLTKDDWTTPIQYDVPVKVQFTFPVVFVLK